jgi:broad specificity phosphatase PhoE
MIDQFVFLHRGETDWNCLGFCVGQQDRVLTPDGQDQARQAKSAVLAYWPSMAFTSPLIRARQTTATVLEGWSGEVVVDDGFAEVCLGEMEGRPEGQADDDFVAGWLSGRVFPGAGPYPLFQARVLAAFERSANVVVMAVH